MSFRSRSIGTTPEAEESRSFLSGLGFRVLSKGAAWGYRGLPRFQGIGIGVKGCGCRG